MGDNQSFDYGEAGITNVRSEWGMNDGRVSRAMDFYQMFVTVRGANGSDSASDQMRQVINPLLWLIEVHQGPLPTDRDPDEVLNEMQASYTVLARHLLMQSMTILGDKRLEIRFAETIR